MATDWIKTMRDKLTKSGWLIMVLVMIVLWVSAGFGLKFIDDDNLISDWINSAVAIGTVGAVITSLYLANKKFNYRGAIRVLEPLNQRHSYLDITCCNKTDREINFIQAVAYSANGTKLDSTDIYEGNDANDSALGPYEQKIISLQNQRHCIYDNTQLGYFLLQTNFGSYKLYVSGKCVYAGFKNNITRP